MQTLARILFHVDTRDSIFLRAIRTNPMNPCSASGLSYCEIW